MNTWTSTHRGKLVRIVIRRTKEVIIGKFKYGNRKKIYLFDGRDIERSSIHTFTIVGASQASASQHSA